MDRGNETPAQPVLQVAEAKSIQRALELGLLAPTRESRRCPTRPAETSFLPLSRNKLECTDVHPPTHTLTHIHRPTYTHIRTLAQLLFTTPRAGSSTLKCERRGISPGVQEECTFLSARHTTSHHNTTRHTPLAHSAGRPPRSVCRFLCAGWSTDSHSRPDTMRELTEKKHKVLHKHAVGALSVTRHTTIKRYILGKLDDLRPLPSSPRILMNQLREAPSLPAVTPTLQSRWLRPSTTYYGTQLSFS